MGLGLGNSLTKNTYELTAGSTVYTPGDVIPNRLQWWYVSDQSTNPSAGEWESSDSQLTIMNQVVTAKQPTIVNTNPGYAEFDGVNDFYRLDDPTRLVDVQAGRGATFMFVYKINTIDANHSIVSGGQGFNTKFSFPANDRFRIQTETAQQLFVASSGTPFDTSGIKILFVVRDSSGAVTLQTHGGGTLEALSLDNSNSSNTTSNTVIKLHQMSGDDNDGLNSFKGRIHEIAIWQNAQLSQTDMDNIYTTYLNPRYNV
jgi:hypothetical protein|tara:strand:- start:1771 stop:2544 length:774 start_codon:yes stop_codon:yes gene_type:complete